MSNFKELPRPRKRFAGHGKHLPGQPRVPGACRKKNERSSARHGGERRARRRKMIRSGRKGGRNSSPFDAGSCWFRTRSFRFPVLRMLSSHRGTCGAKELSWSLDIHVGLGPFRRERASQKPMLRRQGNGRGGSWPRHQPKLHTRLWPCKARLPLEGRVWKRPLLSESDANSHCVFLAIILPKITRIRSLSFPIGLRTSIGVQ